MKTVLPRSNSFGRLTRASLWASLFTLGGCTLGPTELAMVLAIVVLLFGATRLPQLGRALGETLRSFRKASSEQDGDPKTLDENKQSSPQIRDADLEDDDSDNRR